MSRLSLVEFMKRVFQDEKKKTFNNCLPNCPLLLNSNAQINNKCKTIVSFSVYLCAYL